MKKRTGDAIKELLAENFSTIKSWVEGGETIGQITRRLEISSEIYVRQFLCFHPELKKQAIENGRARQRKNPPSVWMRGENASS